MSNSGGGYESIKSNINERSLNIYKLILDKYKNNSKGNDISFEEIGAGHFSIDEIARDMESITRFLFTLELDIINYSEMKDFDAFYFSVNKLRLDVNVEFINIDKIQDQNFNMEKQLNSIQNKIKMFKTFKDIKKENPTFFEHLIKHFRGL